MRRTLIGRCSCIPGCWLDDSEQDESQTQLLSPRRDARARSYRSTASTYRSGTSSGFIIETKYPQRSIPLDLPVSLDMELAICAVVSSGVDEVFECPVYGVRLQAVLLECEHRGSQGVPGRRTWSLGERGLAFN